MRVLCDQDYVVYTHFWAVQTDTVLQRTWIRMEAKNSSLSIN